MNDHGGPVYYTLADKKQPLTEGTEHGTLRLTTDKEPTWEWLRVKAHKHEVPGLSKFSLSMIAEGPDSVFEVTWTW